MVKVHGARMYQPSPNAIYCIALDPQKRRLAVSRSDASIEIWHITHLQFVERAIASSTENYSIEGLAWKGNRLFSVGLHGFLVEYDLYKLCVKSKLAVTGQSAFCLDINKQGNQIAVGTEQGYLNIFNFVEEEVRFSKFLDKQEGRIMCLKYHHSGEYVVSGSTDTIRIWNIESGHALHKLSTGRAESTKPTIVWCLAVTEDFTIISGDSRGRLTFWDGNIGSQIVSYQSHRADILAVCLSDDQKTLFCAGIDPLITSYMRVQVNDKPMKWVKSVQRRVHDHDVRALVVNGAKLYSGGVDGYLACSHYPPKSLVRFPSIPLNPVVIAKEARYIMFKFPQHIEVWTLGECAEEYSQELKMYPITVEPKKLLHLYKTVKMDDGGDKKEGIICCNMPENGKYIVYSTRLGTRLFKFIYANGCKPVLIPMDERGNFGTSPCVNAVFTSAKELILALNSGGLQVFSLENDRPCLVQTISTASMDTITFLTISACGKYLVAGDPKSNICAWVRENDKFTFHCKLPKHYPPPTAMAIHPISLNVAVVYADHKLVDYHLPRRQLDIFAPLCSRMVPRKLKALSHPIRSVQFDPRDPLSIILQEDGNLATVNKIVLGLTREKLVKMMEMDINPPQDQVQKKNEEKEEEEPKELTQTDKKKTKQQPGSGSKIIKTSQEDPVQKKDEEEEEEMEEEEEEEAKSSKQSDKKRTKQQPGSGSKMIMTSQEDPVQKKDEEGEEEMEEEEEEEAKSSKQSDKKRTKQQPGSGSKMIMTSQEDPVQKKDEEEEEEMEEEQEEEAKSSKQSDKKKTKQQPGSGSKMIKTSQEDPVQKKDEEGEEEMEEEEEEEAESSTQSDKKRTKQQPGSGSKMIKTSQEDPVQKKDEEGEEEKKEEKKPKELIQIDKKRPRQRSASESQIIQTSSRNPVQKKNEQEGEEKEPKKLIESDRHMVWFSALSRTEFLLVEVNLMDQLPPASMQNSFGRK